MKRVRIYERKWMGNKIIGRKMTRIKVVIKTQHDKIREVKRSINRNNGSDRE